MISHPALLLLLAVLLSGPAPDGGGSLGQTTELAAPAAAEAAARLAREAAELLAKDLYEDALDKAGAATGLCPDCSDAHVAMADALYRRGDFDEAERGYRRAVELNADDHAAHFGMGRILRTLGRYGEAATHFSRAAALAPETPRYLRVLANHLARREDSIAMLKRYLELMKAGGPATIAETSSMVRNVEAWLALLEKAGGRPLNELARSRAGPVRLNVARGQAYVSLRLGRLDRQRFVFDTGATGVTVSHRLASRLKLTPIRPFTITGSGASRTETGDLVLIEEIAVGEGILLRNVPATVRDPDGPEEGLIGPSLFHAFDITIDLKAGRLVFEPPSTAHSGRTLPFRNVGGEILIEARLNGVPLNGMLDTGAASTIVGNTALGRVPGLQTMPGSLLRGTVVGIGGPLADQRAILKGTLSFAGRDYLADGLTTGDLSGMSRALESEVYIILGSVHLDDSPFTIDYAGMTVTFLDGSPAGP